MPRFIVSETRDVTQSFNVAFRTPTGSTFNGNGVAAVTPTYEFWANWWQGLVLRGGVGFGFPYGHQSIDEVGARTTFIANLRRRLLLHPARPHAVRRSGVVSVDEPEPDDRQSRASETTVTLTPGFRTHLGRNWYLLGAVEVPVTRDKPFDYQVLGGLMKVF